MADPRLWCAVGVVLAVSCGGSVGPNGPGSNGEEQERMMYDCATRACDVGDDECANDVETRAKRIYMKNCALTKDEAWAHYEHWCKVYTEDVEEYALCYVESCALMSNDWWPCDCPPDNGPTGRYTCDELENEHGDAP